MRKYEKMEHLFSVTGDYEVTCNVQFHYYPGRHGSYLDPPEPESVEIVGVEYVSGARTEVEEAGFMVDVDAQMRDEDFLVELEEIILQHVADEADRMADAHYDGEMERRIDAAIAQSQEEDA